MLWCAALVTPLCSAILPVSASRFLEGLLSRHPKGAAKVQHPPVK